MQGRGDLPTAIGRPAICGEKEIANLRGVGPKSIGMLREELAARGLSFADGQGEEALKRTRKALPSKPSSLNLPLRQLVNAG